MWHRALVALAIAGGVAVAAAPARAGESVAELFASSFAAEDDGDTAAALNDVLKIVRAHPGHYTANLRAGWLYYKKGRYDDSVRFYRAAAKLAPKATEPRLGMMLPLMAAKRWTDAEKIARQVLERAPRNYLAGARLAYVLFAQGRYKAAERAYARVLEDVPSDLEMQLGLAWTYLRQGRKRAARATFEHVLEVRRDNVSAKSGLQAL